MRGTDNEWFNNIDLRVDNSKEPFSDLQRLLNYHYGRIRLNQAVMAIQNGNIQRGQSLLKEAIGLVNGWNGLMGKVAVAWLLLHEEAKAVAVIRNAVDSNLKWRENLPAFYVLKDQPGMQGLINEKKFSEKDWIAAASLFEQLNRPVEWEAVCRKALGVFPNSSYLYYLLGEALHAEKKEKEAKAAVEMAIQLDPQNTEAISTLKDIK